MNKFLAILIGILLIACGSAQAWLISEYVNLVQEYNNKQAAQRDINPGLIDPIYDDILFVSIIFCSLDFLIGLLIIFKLKTKLRSYAISLFVGIILLDCGSIQAILVDKYHKFKNQAYNFFADLEGPEYNNNAEKKLEYLEWAETTTYFDLEIANIGLTLGNFLIGLGITVYYFRKIRNR